MTIETVRKTSFVPDTQRSPYEDRTSQREWLSWRAIHTGERGVSMCIAFRPKIVYGELIERAFRKVDEQLRTQTDEHELLNILDDAWPILSRWYWRPILTHNAAGRQRLDAAYACYRALPRFIEICEDIEDIKYRSEAQDLMNDLAEIAESFRGCAVCARVKKEYRGLKERLNTLPAAEDDPYELERNRRINVLNREAPICSKPNCGSRMAIRACNTNAWWGCSIFPSCFSRKSLTKKQKAYLMNG